MRKETESIVLEVNSDWFYHSLELGVRQSPLWSWALQRRKATFETSGVRFTRVEMCASCEQLIDTTAEWTMINVYSR